MRGVPDIGLLLLTTRDGSPVYVRDVAKVVVGPSAGRQPGLDATPAARRWRRVPAVSVALAKRAGANAVVVSQAIIAPARGAEGPWLIRR